jgi:polar amino acid transport system substrate-binding protein
MMKKIAGLLALVALISGCVTSNVEPDPSILRVGISPNSQPVVFKSGGRVQGIEIDFAEELGQALNRRVVLIEVPWNKQIDYLEQDKTDIIMSGMTVTGPRSIRINFSTPYMRSGMSGLFRRDAYDPSGLLASTIINQNKRIGYIKHTTGEIFVMQRFPRGEKKSFSNKESAVKALKNGKIDMFIHDAPQIWWLSAINESDLVAFPDVLNVELLAWGIPKHDRKLLDEVNLQLAHWEKNGTSKRIIQNWCPAVGK